MGIQPSAVVLVLTLVGGVVHPAAWAQRFQNPFRRTEPAPPPRPVDRTITRVVLGTGSGIPGESAVVPIEFTPAEGANIRLMKLSIDFASRNMKYVKLDPGPASDADRVELAVEDYVTLADEWAPSSKLTIRVALLPNYSGQQGIPAGVIGRLNFRINDDADGAIVALDVTAEATEIGANAALPSQKLRAEEGAVFVLAPGGPGNGCFFFTH